MRAHIEMAASVAGLAVLVVVCTAEPGAVAPWWAVVGVALLAVGEGLR